MWFPYHIDRQLRRLSIRRNKRFSYEATAVRNMKHFVASSVILFQLTFVFPLPPVGAGDLERERSGAPNAALYVLTGGYPRAFFFRVAEALAAKRTMDYDTWDKTFRRLMGIEGKVLEEEIPGRSARNPAFFLRFKAEHPRQLVLLHYNGNARDPRFERESFFAGHWLYYVGATILSDVPAEEGSTEIVVSDVRLFRTNIGRYRNKNDDIALCELDEHGRPDWFRSEQVRLQSIDPERSVIRVARAQYGTAARSFTAGSAYAAAHVTEGPWGSKSNLLWFYNYSTRCPRDSKGRLCLQVHAEDIARRFKAGGRLEAFDGIEFDVLHFELGTGGRRKDFNGDGKADEGWFDGVNTYGLGVFEFTRLLRTKLPHKLLLADGHHRRNQRSVGILNGIESEGWPDARDPQLKGWSSGLNRHFYWNAFGRSPVLHYINHKYTAPGNKPGHVVRPQVPFSTHRLVMAAAVFTGAAFCYSYQPPKEPGERVGIWDELVQGRARRVGWLGRPLGPPLRLAMQTQPKLGGSPGGVEENLLTMIEGDGIRYRLARGVLTLAGEPKARGISFTLRGIPAEGPDLFVTMKVRGAPLPGYPPSVPRLAEVTLPASELWLITADLPEAGMARRNSPEQKLQPESGARLVWRPRVTLGKETHEAYFVHPPFRGGKTGYTFWIRDVTVPAGGRLSFFLGLGERACGRSDGVTFRVYVAELKGKTPGTFKLIFEHSQRAAVWTRHVVGLGAWAGKRVRLKFVSDAGPRDNSTTDHSYWGDALVTGPGGSEELTPRQSQTTLIGPKAFRSCFYFHHVRSKSVDLHFMIEGRAQVELLDFAVYAHPDVIARRFEGGLVLANPSPAPFTFDLARLFPGETYIRLRGSPSQDPKVNNGQPVGPRITLPAMDAIFLLARSKRFSGED